MLKALGIKSEFKGGLRVTTPEAMDATSMYNMYETRQRRMYVETFATLCSYFGVSADDLLGTGKEE